MVKRNFLDMKKSKNFCNEAISFSNNLAKLEYIFRIHQISSNPRKNKQVYSKLHHTQLPNSKFQQNLHYHHRLQ